MYTTRMQPARVGQGVVGTLAALTGIARDVQTAQQALSSAWSQLTALRKGASAAPARVGQALTSNAPLPVGTRFSCVPRVGEQTCTLYDWRLVEIPSRQGGSFSDERWVPTAVVPAGAPLLVALPNLFVPTERGLVLTNRTNNAVRVQTLPSLGRPRAGWIRLQHLRPDPLAPVSERPVLVPSTDPRGPVSERVFERGTGLRIPTEVLR